MLAFTPHVGDPPPFAMSGGVESGQLGMGRVVSCMKLIKNDGKNIGISWVSPFDPPCIVDDC